jgi:hypothetical protein
MFSTITTLFSALFSTDTTTTTNTVDDVRNAIQEANRRQYGPLASLGLPEVKEGDGEFDNPVIAVPISGLPYVGDQEMYFRVPRGEDDEQSNFPDLLAQMGLSFENMEELEGCKVPVTVEDGNVSVKWRQVEQGDPADDSEKEGVVVEEKTINSDD